MSALFGVYTIGAVIFGATFSRQYYAAAVASGLRYPMVAAVASALFWPINVVSTLLYGFKNRA